jgi:ABC-2 type transport system permease protein
MDTMLFRRSHAIARQELRLLRHDSFPLLAFVVMPLIGMVFMKSAFRTTLVAAGVPHATGAEQAVPGIAVTFGPVLIGSVGYGFYREHAWKTWQRLRAAPVSTAEIMCGKMILPLIQAGGQFVLLFGVGGLLLGLQVNGSWGQLVLVAAAFTFLLIALGLAITAVCQTVMQANAAAYVGGLLGACLGGALIPYSTLPPWARAIAPITPHYWAMRGYQNAILDRGESVLPCLAVLVLFGLTFTVIAAWRLRFDDAKTGFTVS